MPPQTENHVATVSIYDQVYTLRGQDPAYIEMLAALVDERMRTVAAHGATVDSLRVAVLAALNLADELTLARAELAALAGAEQARQSRAHSLTGMLDEVLEDAHTG